MVETARRSQGRTWEDYSGIIVYEIHPYCYSINEVLERIGRNNGK